MKYWRLLLIVALFSSQFFYGQIPAGYYDSAAGLSGDALKSALNDIIDGHTELSYTQAKDALMVTDEDPNNSNNVICLYTGWSYAKTDFNNGSEGWNREHVWSKSHGDFGTSPPAGTDIHHLRPADISVNSAKSNRDFDYGVTEYIDGSGATGCYTDTYIWEPRDQEKGDVARMIFYMATRYEGENGEVDLEIVDYVNTAPNNNEPYYGKLSTLIQWNQDDPVDNWEINRNNIIYNDYQGNRNPFIDHPEYVNLIWGSNPEPSNHVLNFTYNGVSSSSIALTWNDNDGTNVASKYLIMINTTGTFTTPVDGTENADDTDISDGSGQYNVNHGVETYTFTGLDASTQYYFEIYPYANFGSNIDYKTDGTIPSTNATTLITGTGVYLFISEVADPSDVYQSRFVELYNAGPTLIDFSTEVWYLCRQANGSSTSWGDIQLTGSVNSGSAYTIAYNASSFSSSYGGINADLISGYISGNGNDGYFLFSGGNHSTGQLVDAYGVIDEDGSGTQWDYLDSKAVRKRMDTIPSQTWLPSQWVVNASAGTTDMTPSSHRTTLTWTGSQSVTWGDNSNWNVAGGTSSFKPDAGNIIIIPSTTNSPIITGEASCDELRLDAGVTLNIDSGTLTVGH